MVRTSLCLAVTLFASAPVIANPGMPGFLADATDWQATRKVQTAVYYAGQDTIELKGVNPSTHRVTHVNVCADAAKDAKSDTRSNNMLRLLTDKVGEGEVNGITAVVMEKNDAETGDNQCLRLRYFYF